MTTGQGTCQRESEQCKRNSQRIGHRAACNASGTGRE
jgi:hypothetical protein